MRPWSAVFLSGVEACWKAALAGPTTSPMSTLENFSLPGDVSASSRYWAEDIIEPEVTVSSAGEIRVPTTPGRGFEVRTDLVERLTVRKEEIKVMALVS